MEGRLLTWSNCSLRVMKAIEKVADMIARSTNGSVYPGIAEVLAVAEDVIAQENYKPCITVNSYEEYVGFLANYVDRLARAVMNIGMEAVSRHLDRIGFNTYALLSVTLMGYSLTEMQLLSVFRSTLPSMDVDELSTYEPLVFSSILRFMGYAYYVSKTSNRRIKSNIKTLVHLAEKFSNEDQQLASILSSSWGGRLQWINT